MLKKLLKAGQRMLSEKRIVENTTINGDKCKIILRMPINLIIYTIKILRLTSLIFYLNIGFPVLAQEVKQKENSGIYSFVGEDTDWEIDLYANGRFFKEVHYSGLLYAKFYGKWEINNNVLYLNYKMPKKRKKCWYFQNHCQVREKTDSVYIYTYDHNRKPINYAESQLYFYYEDNTKKCLTKIGDNVYKVHKSEIPKIINTYIIGYLDVNLRFKEKKGNCIHLYFVEEFRVHKKRDIYRFEDGIVKVNNYIKLKKLEE